MRGLVYTAFCLVFFTAYFSGCQSSTKARAAEEDPGRQPPKEPRFLLHKIGDDHAEGITVMDVDGDGKPDVTSGGYWYQAPPKLYSAEKWIQHPLREAPRHGEFVSDCGEFSFDVNGDGYPDIISAGWQDDGIFWFENPHKTGVLWAKHLVMRSFHTEGFAAEDVDGDGVPDLVPAHYTPSAIYWLQVKGGKVTPHLVGKQGDGHGAGVGDVDGDGKKDILTTKGWWRQINLAADQWEWHPEWNLHEAGFEIIAYDVNGDGLTDIIYGRGHSYGLYWLEQGKDKAGSRTWTQHVIDESYSQIHNVKLVDLDGDGKPELLAGKRYRGHDGKDPGGYDPLCLYYYKIDTKTGTFTRHPIAYNSTAGAGTQFVVTDLDGDGDLDILVAGKSGQYWFENLTVNNVSPQERYVMVSKWE